MVYYFENFSNLVERPLALAVEAAPRRAEDAAEGNAHVKIAGSSNYNLYYVK